MKVRGHLRKETGRRLAASSSIGGQVIQVVLIFLARLWKVTGNDEKGTDVRLVLARFFSVI